LDSSHRIFVFIADAKYNNQTEVLENLKIMQTDIDFHEAILY